MKSGLEVQMKEMLNEASIKELLPDFDQEILWRDVAATLPEPQPKKRVPLHSIIAAAALLLVMTCTYLIYQSLPSAKETGGLATAHRSLAIPAAKNVLEGALPTQATSPAVQAQNVAQPQTISSINTKNTTALPAQNVPIQNPRPFMALPSASNSVAQADPVMAPATPKKMTHYLDLDDAAETPTVAEAPAPALIQLKLNKPEFSTVGNAQKPFREITFALGK